MQKNGFTSLHGRWITTAFFVLALYVTGAAMMDSFVVYHTWKFIGDTEFPIAHIESGNRIVQVFVFPLLLTTVLLVLLFWHRAIAIPRRLLWIALACLGVAWLSSIFIQIPMQLELDKGKNTELLQKLVDSDWIRFVPQVIFLATVIAMISKTITPNATIITTAN